MNLSDDINDFCFFDTETRARSGVRPPLNSVKTAGTYAYARNAYAIILTYCIGDGPVQCVAMDEGFDEAGFMWKHMPLDLRQFWVRASQGDGWFAAWNTGFDRTAWNRSTANFPYLAPEATIDVMAQAVASNLPPALEGASRFIGRGGKQDDGKRLIELFCGGDPLVTPQSHPEEWERFKSYAVRDTGELREVFRATRQLPRSDWEEYWASEHINERGFEIDMEFARRCSAIADLNVRRSNKRLAEITGEHIDRVTQRERIANWVYDKLEHAEAREIMVKAYDPDSEDELKPAKIGISRDRIEALLAFFDALEEKQGGLTDIDCDICEVLEIRQWDGSSSPAKFDKMLAQHDDGCLRGSYVFNGANQTGRFSSKGVQVHNLPNKFIGLEEKNPELEAEAIDMINELEI